MRLSSLALSLCTMVSSSAQSGQMDQSFNALDMGFGKGDGGLGTIECVLEEPNGDLIVFKGLRHLDGKARTEIARIHPDGSLDPGFDPAESLANTNRSILDVARQSDGKLVIVGNYSTFGGQASSGITRLFPDGTVDPNFNVTLSGPTKVIVQNDDKLLVLHAGNLSRLMPDGEVDLSFAPAGPANIENIVVMPDGRILYSYSSGPYSRALSMRLPDGSIDASFDQSGLFNLSLHDIVVLADGRLLVCGPFTQWNDTPVKGLVRLNANGSLDTSFDPVNDTEAITVAQTVLAETNGDLLVACKTTSSNGDFTGLRRLASNGAIDMDFRITFDQLPAKLLHQSNGGTIAVGYFRHVQGSYRRSIVRLQADATVDPGFLSGTGSHGEINYVEPLSDGRILVGGTLLGYDGVMVHSLTRLNEDGSRDLSFDPGTGPQATNPNYLAINTISPQPDGKYIVGGSFETFNGQAASGAVRLHADGSMDASFRSDQLTGTVSGTLLLSGGAVILYGRFGTTPNAPAVRSSLVRSLPDGTLDAGFNASFQPGIYGAIHEVRQLPSDQLLVAGFYNFIGGQARRNLARLNADGSIDEDFEAAIAFEQWEEVTAIAVQDDGKVLLATSFGRMFRLFPDGGWDQAFDAGSGFDMPYDPVLIKDIIPLSDGRMIVAGRFASYDGTDFGHIVCLNADGSVNPDFTSGTGFFNYLGPAPLEIAANGVNDLAVDHVGRLLAVGAFTEYNGMGRNRIARFDAALPTGVSIEARDRMIHPNPSSGVFQVSNPTGHFKIEITDASGRLVHQQRNAMGSTSYHIDLSHQPTGIYFARIHAAEGISHEQLLIIR